MFELDFNEISRAVDNDCGYDGGAKETTLPCVATEPSPDEFGGWRKRGKE